MPKLDKQRFPSQLACQAPIAAINQYLGFELSPGGVWVSVACHQHIALNHPDTYQACYPHLASLIPNPSFLGQSPHHSETIEIIKRFRGQGGEPLIALMALRITANKHGNYHLETTYLIEDKDLDARRSAKRIVSVV